MDVDDDGASTDVPRSTDLTVDENISRGDYEPITMTPFTYSLTALPAV